MFVLNNINSVHDLHYIMSISLIQNDDNVYECNNLVFNNIDIELTNIGNTSYKLNLNKNTYSELEHFVNQITQYHISRLAIINMKKCIEFSVVSGNNNDFNTVYDKQYYEKHNKKKNPLLSIIANFKNSICQLLLTDINNEQYKFKLFDDQTQVRLFMLKTYQHIAFDSSKFYGCSNMLNINNDNLSQPYLLINIWEDSYDDIPYYSNNNIIHTDIPITINSIYCEQIDEYTGDVHNFFEKLLYKHTCMFEPDHSKLAYDIKYTLYKIYIQKIKDPTVNTVCRLLQTFHYGHAFPDWMCKLFTNNFNTIRNGANSVDIESIPNISSYFFLQFPYIFEEINYFYSIQHSNVNIQYVKICQLSGNKLIIKDDVNDNESTILHMYICVNNKNNDSSLIVNGNISLYLNQGSMITVPNPNGNISFNNIHGDEICIVIRVKLDSTIFTEIKYEPVSNL